MRLKGTVLLKYILWNAITYYFKFRIKSEESIGETNYFTIEYLKSFLARKKVMAV